MEPGSSLDIKVFVDADATPRDVMQSVREISERRQATVITVSTLNHHVEGPNHITVDAHPQAVDMKILSLISQNEATIVVTQDYGLAALALGKGALAISPHGIEYTETNIDRLLFERALHAHERRATGRNKGPRARTAEDAKRFAQVFEMMLNRTVSAY